jgi:hypothetical protein
MSLRKVVLPLCLVMMGGAAMAIEKSPSVKREAPPAKGSLEEFYQTPEGQYAKRILNFILKGDKLSAQREYEEGQEKFGWKPYEAPKSQPQPYQDPRGPMQLPPEFR